MLSFLAEFNHDPGNVRLQLLTCEEIGSVLGVSSESVSRILAEFKRGHIIFIDDAQPHEIYSADLGRLQQISEQA